MSKKSVVVRQQYVWWQLRFVSMDIDRVPAAVKAATKDTIDTVKLPRQAHIIPGVLIEYGGHLWQVVSIQCAAKRGDRPGEVPIAVLKYFGGN